jgi:putative FmdB family regulatory protein
MTRLPTYEYRCDSCEKNFDVVQSFHDDPVTACPTCGSRVRKVFGNVGIVFKGSGFYKTDSRPGAAKAPAGEAGASGSSGSEGSGGESATPAAASTGDGPSTTSTSESTKAPSAPPVEKTPAKTSSKEPGS